MRAELEILEKGNETVEQLIRQSGDDAGTWEGYKLSVTLGKAQENPDSDYSQELKQQATDYGLATAFSKNSNGINSGDVQNSIKTGVEAFAEFLLTEYQTERAALSSLQNTTVNENTVTGKNVTTMLLSVSSSVFASAGGMGDFQKLTNKTESALDLLNSLVDVIDTYPRSTVWNLWGLWKTKAQKAVVSDANDIKDKIKQTNEYLNDQEFKGLVDEVFSEKSYKNINKKDDIQRLIDYLTGKQPDPTATPTPTSIPTPTATPSPTPTLVPPSPTPVPKDYETVSSISKLTAVEGYQKVYIVEIESFAYIYITNGNEKLTFSIGKEDEQETVSKIVNECDLNPKVVTNAGFFDSTEPSVEHFGVLRFDNKEWETVSNNKDGINVYDRRVIEANTFIQWPDRTEIRKITDAAEVKDAIWAVGAGYSLVQNGTIAVEIEDNKIVTTGNDWYDPGDRRSRTMFGVNSQGNYISVVVERSKVSKGANAYIEAKIMHQLGAVNAINFDGGGSSTFWYGSVKNKPETKKGDERKIGSVMIIFDPNENKK
ncbi:MAG: phosphodiester glycosidase family protein [Ruminiclostridium sp.]|nr:phosphodiester glycosidase family protein [Ruminiclostridium sp.]